MSLENWKMWRRISLAESFICILVDGSKRFRDGIFLGLWLFSCSYILI